MGFSDPANWVVMLATLLVVTICVVLHYEVLSALTTLLRRVRLQSRARILVLIPSIILVHVTQIWVYGLAYFLLLRDPSYGSLTGMANLNLFDYVYYSAVVFTTLG